MMNARRYEHVTGLYGDSGENAGALAVHAVLDPSPNYPEDGRIIVGSPASTPTIPGYIPNLGGFNGGPDAIERLASTLQQAVHDVRAATTMSGTSTFDDKPSIADLYRMCRDDRANHDADLALVTPVLLEIVTAAQSLVTSVLLEIATTEQSPAPTEQWSALVSALAKVRQ
jgi:hypothetical protein